MSIKVGFSRHKGFAPLSWLIMLVENTKFSHTYIKIYSDSLNRSLIYQANNAGVWFIGEPAFLNKNIEVETYTFELSNLQKTKLLQFCVDNSGKTYGKLQLIGMAIVRFVKFLFNKKINNPFSNGTNQYVCSELVLKTLEEINYLHNENQDTIGISDLAIIVKSLNKGIQNEI